MPELPDILCYLGAIRTRIVGRQLDRIRFLGPFVLRSVSPHPAEMEGLRAAGVRRIGKRVVLEFEGERFAVIHLMISGRLHWKERGARLAGKAALAAFDFENGSLTLTEAASRKRASIHLVSGESGLAEFGRGGIEPLECDEAEFRSALTRENHTLKRSLTDPTLFSGIGNAYSDEILHRARLSPVKWTTRLAEAEAKRLFAAAREVLFEWTERLAREAGDRFPEKVTAFRPEMAVHGKFGQPCPVCRTPVQRIVYAENECNYCPACQTEGRLLADRSLSRLLKGDWPRSLQELEERQKLLRV